MGELVSPSDREALIRSAFLGVADDMAALGTAKSGKVIVHFQNGLPMKVEWQTVAEAIRYRDLQPVEGVASWPPEG